MAHNIPSAESNPDSETDDSTPMRRRLSTWISTLWIFSGVNSSSNPWTYLENLEPANDYSEQSIASR